MARTAATQACEAAWLGSLAWTRARVKVVGVHTDGKKAEKKRSGAVCMKKDGGARSTLHVCCLSVERRGGGRWRTARAQRGSNP